MPICWKCGRMGSTGQVSGGSIDVEGKHPVFTGRWRCVDGKLECEGRAKTRARKAKGHDAERGEVGAAEGGAGAGGNRPVVAGHGTGAAARPGVDANPASAAVAGGPSGKRAQADLFGVDYGAAGEAPLHYTVAR
jgi:hypothetical protein